MPPPTVDASPSVTPQEDAIRIFTDGSFDAKARTGGWAFVVMEADRQIHAASGRDHGTSNNTFEIMAVVEAPAWLDAFASDRAVAIWTDSAHVIEGCARWRAIWRTNGWKRIDPNPRARRRRVQDALLWQKLDALLIRNPKLTIAWCKAHSGIAGNDHADALAGGKAFSWILPPDGAKTD